MATKKQSSPVASKLPPVPKTAEGVRDALFDALNGLRAGTLPVADARCIAVLSRYVIEAARLELVHRNALKVSARGSLQLGSKE